jgi:hydrogenase maturation protein HypF
VAWDGTGYGLDGHIWGGEFLVGDYRGFRRAGHLEYLPMPGGDAATLDPWRLAAGYLAALGEEPPAFPEVGRQELRIVLRQVELGLNTPLTSAAGRLFDAVAVLAGVGRRVTYEAQAAIELEMAATRWAQTSREEEVAYPFDLETSSEGTIIRLRPLFRAVQADLSEGASSAQIGWRFHRTMAEVIGRVCQGVAAEAGLRTVALSGGCFQSRLLLSMTVERLEEAGLRVLVHCHVPCNDGGLSLGQAVLAHFAYGERPEDAGPDERDGVAPER